ncbi:MAG: SDR family oxidoreductase [Thermomicrobiales bacterium]|nr:SDR family oxidoreductase [Thermomicrobiales bacterium]MCO5223143.1 SDR family oxidoreductase [Thermomicrobiales bacterium]
MTTLVTGGAGFVGANLCERLIADGETVIALDNLVTGRASNLAALESNPAFTLITHDLNEELPELPRLDRIYHCASPASPPEYQKFPIETLLVNAEGTRRLLDRAVEDGARFLFTSTSEVYGDPLDHPQREDYRGHVSSTGPRSMYDESKRYAEALITAYAGRYGIETRIVRIFNTYGPHMAPHDGRVVSNFIVQAIKGEPLTMYGTGQQTRSFQYVDDLIEGMVRLMNSSYSGPVNIGNPNEFTMLELATKVLAKTGSQSEIEFLPLPVDDPNRRRPDITLAKTLLGWEPRVSLDEGLTKTIAYYRSQVLGEVAAG